MDRRYRLPPAGDAERDRGRGGDGGAGGRKEGRGVLAIDQWVRALSAILLLAGITEMLLPSGALKGYARSLLGLLVLLGVLQPVVGLVKGDIHLDLPALLAPLSATTDAQAPTAAATSAAVTAYEQLVAGQTARIAQQVPGVQAASATLRFAAQPDAEPAVSGAAVEVSPTEWGAADRGGLTRRIQAAVAAGLGIAESAVSVTLW